MCNLFIYEAIWFITKHFILNWYCVVILNIYFSINKNHSRISLCKLHVTMNCGSSSLCVRRRLSSVVRRLSSVVVVVVRKLFQKSSPLKPLHGLSWNFACMFFSVLAIKFMFEFLISWKTWRLLLKIEHRVKTMFFANISKNILHMKKAVTWEWSWDRDLPFLKISRKFKIFCRSYCPFCGFFGKI